MLRIIPEHQRGLHTREASEACHGFTSPAALDTPYRTESAHRTCRALANQLRNLLGEYGFVVPHGIGRIRKAMRWTGIDGAW